MATTTDTTHPTQDFSIENLYYRNVTPTDLPKIYSMEQSSYPRDESASRSKLQYRQHHAAPYFRAAIFLPDQEVNGDCVDSNVVSDPTATIPADNDDMNRRRLRNSNSLNGIGDLIGFITATRCHKFTEESMSVHDPNGSLLAIHSVVVSPNFRNRGVGAAMLQNYIGTLSKMRLKHGISKIMLMAKAEKLTFYIKAGFSVIRKSPIVHGKEPWYECEYELKLNGTTEKKLPCWIVDSFALTPLLSKSSIKGSRKRIQSHGDSNGSSGNDNIPSTTTRGGSGNPAAVVLVPKHNHKGGLFDPHDDASIAWMKTVANEFQLSETAFIWEYDTTGESMTNESNERYSSPLEEIDRSTHYSIRFYTRDGSEVHLCGHATLAASSVVFQRLISSGKKGDISVTFHTKDDTLLKVKPALGSNSMSSSHSNSFRKIVMDFPWKDLVPLTKSSTDWTQVMTMIRDAFFPTLECDKVENNCVQYVGVDDGGDDLFVELTCEAFASVPTNIRDINLNALMTWSGYQRGVILCCEMDNEVSSEAAKPPYLNGVDFMSRFFGPKVGIEEDPVTGSAHCILAPYFGAKLEKDNVLGFQKSKRGGIVDCSLKKIVINGVVSRKMINICGTAIITMSGSLHL